MGTGSTRTHTSRRHQISAQATLRFYAELKEFLSKDRRSGEVTRSFGVPGSVKDMIEACGVPHTEVDLIVVDGHSVDFSYRVADGDRIAVYPVFESFDITPVLEVRPEPLRTVRFVVDSHLGRLARFLRLLGLDTLYDSTWTDSDLVRISTRDRRVVLTRDVDLLKHGSLTHGHFVRAVEPRQQLIDVVRRFHLARHLSPFTRCMVCNGELISIAKAEIADRLPPETREHIEVFQRCASCNKIYWDGAHHRKLESIVESARRAEPAPL